MLNIFEMLGASFILVLVLMTLLWVIYFFRKNAGIVDIGWALGFVLAMWAYFFLGDGAGAKKWALLIMVTLWGCRLAGHLYYRLITTSEDPRYQEIRRNWGEESSNFKFFMMFIFQGVLVVLLSLPFLIVANRAVPTWQGIEVVGIVVWIIGFIGEAWADRQLATFKDKAENQNKVCREGFWYYSRHPNYFFEFVIWVGYFFFALGTPGGWISFIAPAIMLCLLLKVSGIPLTEEELHKSKGAEYDDYCRTTNPFIPWFPKK
jgi:steroid 5-alpha reductase family enzyme